MLVKGVAVMTRGTPISHRVQDVLIDAHSGVGRADMVEWPTNWPSPDARDVARDRRRDHLLAVCVYLPPARKRAVDGMECEWLQDLRHALNLGGGEWD